MKSMEIVMVPVKDQQQAKAFYSKLGYQVIVEAPMGHGETWLQMGLPGAHTTLSLGSFHAVICETDDIERETLQLKSLGIEVGKADDTPWGKFAWLKDVDGNSICLRQAQ
jgi:catechol 2,3-dioxygenase-like lactoylglutathione lyase family enzyme